MMMKKLFILTIASVTSLLVLCKPAWAEDSVKFTDGFKLGGYSSAIISAPRKGNTEARVDDVSLMLSWENDGRFKFFGELELERPLAWNEDQRFNSKDMYFDLERLYLDYNVSEKINIRAGRFLTPTGRWNLLHAAPLVWSTTRPLATSQLFPIAVNGLMLYGMVPNETQAFEYTLFVEVLKDQIQSNQETMFKNVAGAHFALNNHFNLGLTLTTFTEDTLQSADYRMVGLDFLTHVNDWEFSGEGFQRFTNSSNDGGSGAYLQSAVPLGNQWHWITRIESYHRPNKISSKLSDETSGERWVTGLTKQITPTRRLKMEYVGGSDDLPDAPRGFVGSFAVLF
jgi:hypothetical protein